MKCSLPCHRELWDAPNATAYIVAKEGIESARLASSLKIYTSIDQLISAFMSENWPSHDSVSHLSLALESLSVASLGNVIPLNNSWDIF